MLTPAHSIPAPDDDVYVSELAAQVRALADAVDARLARRGMTVITTSTTSGAVVSKQVTFATPFPAGTSPICSATVESSRPDLHFVSVGGETNTGFTIYLARNSGQANIEVHWTALAP